MNQYNYILVALSLLLVWSAAVCDLRARRIPNVLVMAGVVTGFLLHVLVSGVEGVLVTFYGLIVGLLVLLPGYIMGFTGAGDVKLMAAIGAVIGVNSVIFSALASALFGGVVALVYVAIFTIFHDNVSPWSRYKLMLKTLVVTGRVIYLDPVEGEVMGMKFPFAVSIALGTTGVLAWQV